MLGGRFHIGYLLCVINSSHTFRLIFSKTLHGSYGHTANVHVTFWKGSDIFWKFTWSWTLSFFQHVLNRQYLLFIMNSSQTSKLAFSKLYTVVDALKMCIRHFRIFAIHVFFFINLHQLMTCLHHRYMFWRKLTQPSPFYSWINFNFRRLEPLTLC
jgi:hypothetical protein